VVRLSLLDSFAVDLGYNICSTKVHWLQLYPFSLIY
jgi:hypothetical protein